MYCPECGQQLADTARFCAYCGESLEDASTKDASTQDAPLQEASPLGASPPEGRPAAPPRAPAISAAASGQPSEPAFEIAPFGLRLGGYLIDILVFTMSSFMVGFAIGFISVLANPDVSDDAVETGGAIGGLVWSFLLLWYFNAIGWSPGRALVGIRIVREDRQPPGVGRGLGRTLGAILSSLPLALGYFWAAWDRETRTWHDRMAGTYVIRVS